jgi:hypothetical protein
MKGLLIHKTRDIVEILEKDKLISKNKLSKTPEYDYGGPENVPLIFLSLMFEDKVTYINKQSTNLFLGGSILLDPQILEEYGKKKFKLKKIYKDFFTTEIPDTNVWFNTSWNYGAFDTSYDEVFSVNYNPEKSVKKNIQIFHDAKVSALVNNNLKYDTEYNNLKHDNEIVIHEESIDISKYILGIYVPKDSLRESLKKEYPQYNIMDKKETNKFIKEYF